jgi:hopene-associated glycosyltransferase HpnB
VTAELALCSVGVASVLAWFVIACRRGRFWDLQPTAEDQQPAPPPAAWPTVCIIVPAHNEHAYLPRTLPPLLAQDYPGPWQVVLVDDRSDDGTGELARALGGNRVTVISGKPLPQGWAGKVWAMAQGAELAVGTEYLWLTDADICHDGGSLRRLVAESAAGDLALNSRMARLHSSSTAERLLIPPFLFFFNLLFPMRWVNGAGRTAAAAGGCVLLRRVALERIGGFTAIADEVIDDVNLARAVKGLGMRIRLSVSRGDVMSAREYRTIAPIWRMVRRSAFDQLGYSWPLLVGTLSGLGLLFIVPPALVAVGAVGTGWPAGWRLVLAALGALAWAVMAILMLPTLRVLGVRAVWALSLPLGGLLYGAMTVDSAVRHAAGAPARW